MSFVSMKNFHELYRAYEIRQRLIVFILTLGIFSSFITVAFASDSQASVESGASRTSNSETPGSSKNSKNEAPDHIKEALSLMSSNDKPKFFGAYKAGFEAFTQYGEDWFLVKVIGQPRTTLTKITFIGSLEKSRSLRNKRGTYQSIISDLTINCTERQMVITRVEYKSASFGTGNSVWSIELPPEKESNAIYKTFKNEVLNEFIFKNSCLE